MQLFIENIGNLAPYGILLLVYLFLSFQSELQKNRLFGIPILGVLLLFAGCRETMTPDMENYKQLYEAFGAVNAAFIEPSFIFLCRLLNAVGFDYHALFFVYSFITLLFLYLAIKNYTIQVKLSLLLYVLIPNCFLNMFVEMRQVCAIAIALYATSILRANDKKYRLTRFLAFAILSVLFHYSAIVYWLIFVIAYKAITRTYSTTVYVALILSGLLVPTSAIMWIVRIVAYPIVPAKYQAFLDIFMRQDSLLADPGQLLKYLIYVFLAICFIYWRSSAGDRDSDPVSLNLFVIGVLLLNMSRSTPEVSRLAYYFLIQQIVLCPQIVARVNGKLSKLLAAYCIVLFYLAQFGWGLFYYSPADGYMFLHYRNAMVLALR